MEAAPTADSVLPNERVPTVDGKQPRDTDGDGRYEDVTGDGSLTNSDVVAFFGEQHTPRLQTNATYFDFSGDGELGQIDVVRLFEAVLADDPTDAIEPRQVADADDDGLPDEFEVNVTGTDPGLPDSNATVTSVDESDDGVLDGDEDFTGNGISAATAYEYGLDPHANDTDGDGRPDAVELDAATSATEPDTDGDGLADGHELEWGFDPTDANSSSTRTAANESANDVLDGQEDLSGNGISLARGLQFGVDPLVNDTDGDGLGDRYELATSLTDPTRANSTAGGENDSHVDLDGDGLTTADEAANGTDPRGSDTDGDGLADGREIDLGTDPLDPDTDSDGLPDGAEVDADLDPFAPDTDGDGVQDGNETVTTTTEDERRGASVAITGQGDVASNVSIENGSETVFTRRAAGNASVGQILEVHNESAFDAATLTLSYDESAVGGSESDVAVYHFNETLQSYVRLDSTVDAENDTVSADVEHFSRFAALHAPTWESEVAQPTVEPDEDPETDTWYVPLFLDSFYDGDLSEWQTAHGSVDPDGQGFADPIPDNGEVGVQDRQLRLYSYGCYHTEAAKSIGRYDGQISIAFDWERTQTQGYGVHETSLDVIEGQDAIDYEVLEGYGNDDPLPDAQAGSDEESGEARVRADVNGSFGFGFRNTPRQLFRQGATQCNLGSLDGTELLIDDVRVKAIVENAADSDGDGLPDVLEVNGIPTGWGRVSTNASNPDTDGDGIPDGEELQVDRFVENPRDPDQRYFLAQSDPSRADSDGDGIDDPMERRLGTNPLDADTDGDDLPDGRDAEPLERPEYADTADLDTLIGPNAEGVVIDGVVYGEPGFQWEIDGHDRPAYFGGWMAGSIVPYFDFLADNRDCLLAWNEDLGSNVLDCGGAAISTISSGGSIVGTVTAWSGFGTILGAGSLAIDAGEDVTDAVKITSTYLKANPEDSRAIVQYAGEKLGPKNAHEITKQIDATSIGPKFRRSRQAIKVSDEYGYDWQTSIALVETAKRTDGLADATDAARVADNLESFEDVSSPVVRGKVVEQAAKHSDVRMAERLDARTIEAAYEVGRTDEAARLLEEAGDDGARLLNGLDPRVSSRILEISTGRSNEMRAVLARHQDEIGSLRIEQFAHDATRLEDIDGFDALIKQIADAGGSTQAVSTLYEARVASRIGEARVSAVSQPIYRNGEHIGEVDIVLESGRLVEVKHMDLRQVQSGESRYYKLDDQLRNKYPVYGDSPHEVTVAGLQQPTEGDELYDLARTIETEFEGRNVAYDITFERINDVR